ncbi:hypothetical protein niasHS_010730 [Heterodera schachtii]|uniref:EF-hand domain-containing protein n=1 Tax=Heterodera schachtii TaxID=97005 RepID=A0ABD2J343_HETSC
MTQRQNGYSQNYYYYSDQQRPSFGFDLNSYKNGRCSVPVPLYASHYDEQQSFLLSKQGSASNVRPSAPFVGFRQNSVATESLRCKSFENFPISSQRNERKQQNQQKDFADRRFGLRWFSQQQIGREMSKNIGQNGRNRTEQLTVGEEAAAAPMGGNWAPRTTTPPGVGRESDEGPESVRRTLKKEAGTGGGPSAGQEITAWFQRHSVEANRSEQQPRKGKALEEFDYCWKGDKAKRTESDDGMGNEWPKNSSAIATACRRSATLSQLGHSTSNRYRLSTSRLGTVEARQQRVGSESPSINGLATGGQARIRRRGSLGSVEQQHTRGGRAVNNRDTTRADFLQNYVPIKWDDAEIKQRHNQTAQNNFPLINRSKTLPSFKFDADLQLKRQFAAENIRKRENEQKTERIERQRERSEKGEEIGKPWDYLGRKNATNGEKKLEEEIDKLFEQLGLLDRKNLMNNGEFKNIFESMRKHLPTKETQQKQKQQQQNIGQGQQSFCFTTNGAQKTERQQNAYKKGRRETLLGRSASNNALAERANGTTTTTTTTTPSSSSASLLLSSLSNGEKRQQQRRQSLPKNQPKYGRNLENFWQSMVKTRAAETSPSKQRLPLGLSAAEKLHGICQFTNQTVAEPNQPINVYPRRYGGVIETVAMRRNNYLMEAARTASPSGTSTPTTNSGRATPNFSCGRAFKSASPSIADQSNADFLDFGTPSAKELNKERENRKGCGRFPTVTEEEKGEAVEALANLNGTIIISIGQPQKVGNGNLRMNSQRQQRTSRSPDNVSECSQQSQCSAAKPTTLPQPTPKHNLRDKLISAGFPISRQTTSFFGGNAKNPFYGQKQPDDHQKQKQQPNSAPNFPLTNTVISRVNLFESQQQPTSVASEVANLLQHSLETNRQHLDIVNGTTSGNGQLSPRSSVFRTKSVIVFDFDNLGGTPTKAMAKGQAEENKRKSGEKTKEQPKAKQQKKEEQRRTTAKEEQNAKKETVVDPAIESNASGDKSPRWCADPNDAIRKGATNRIQWERPKKNSDCGAPSAMVQHHQLTNGLISPMVVNSIKLPHAQFIAASVSSIVSGSKPTINIKTNEQIEKHGEEVIEEKNGEKRKEGDEGRKTMPRIAGMLATSPRFHFSAGRPVSKEDNDRVLVAIRELFESRPHAQLHLADFGELCRRMNFAVYCKRAVFDACCSSNGLPLAPILASTSTESAEGVEKAENATREASVDFNQFCVYWNRMISEAHDEASRFVFTLSAIRHSQPNSSPQQQRHILSEDFVPMMMDLILTHPGLHFLKEAPQFYGRYADVVIVRIFWNVNRSWSGRITANELRRSNFLQTFRKLDEVQDINKVTDFFSYEHFYVTYCKFWELDTDHDMIISRDDMRRHCNGALTDRIIDRIFSAAVIRTPPEQRTVPQPTGPIRQQPIETIGFEDFVCFLLAEEDKRHLTSIEYWFRCIDLDGDGQISLYEMEYFYEAIEQKLLAKGMETLALRDVICNLLDSISPANGHSVTRMDLKRSGLAHRFFNTFVNWIKYVDQESSDGERASVKTNEDKELSDWEMFCLSEYELLMSETEQTSNEGDAEEENIDVILDDDEDEEEEDAENSTIGSEKKPRVDENGTVEQRESAFSTIVHRHQTATALT